MLHWLGGVPLQETLDAFRVLHRSGLICYWGVSNFDLASMQELKAQWRKEAEVA